MTSIPAPESFLELVASILLAISFSLSLLSIILGERVFRMFVIALVGTLALYADHAAVYFAAIFIVATAVTELEFLEKLAAIIRGNKDYFDYQKERLSIEEAQSRSAQDAIDVLEEKTPQPPVVASGEASAAGYAVEQLALSYLEKRLADTFERNVRFSASGVSVELDGFLQRSRGRPDILVEVKLLGPYGLREAALRFSKQAKLIQDRYERITRRRSTIRLLLVVPQRAAVGPDVSEVSGLVRDVSHTIQLDVVDFEDIGYSPPRSAA